MRNASSESLMSRTLIIPMWKNAPSNAGHSVSLGYQFGGLFTVSASLPALLAAIILMFFQQLWGKKSTWFCFHKRREFEIYILGFSSNPYKNTCLERILIKFHLEMIDRCNRPIWSQFLQQHKM